jgi:hypothetical protein
MLIKEKISDKFLSQPFVVSLFSQDLVKYLLNNNFWIAGGFARCLYSVYNECDQRKVYINKETKESVKNHLRSPDDVYSGDIDFFTSKKNYETWENNNKFRNKLHENSSISYANRSGKRRSHYTPWLCYKDKYTDNYEYDKTKIQVVNSFFYPDIEECFESFDFTNCRYSIYKENKELYFLYDSDAVKYDKEKFLDIRNANSQMLSHRILKYLSARELNDITKSSFKYIDEHIYKVACNYWGNDLHLDEHKGLKLLQIKRLNDRYKISKELLAILALSLKTLSYGNCWLVDSIALEE